MLKQYVPRINGKYIKNQKKSFKTLFKENYFVFNPVELKKKKIVPLKRTTRKYFISVVIYYKEGGTTIKKNLKVKRVILKAF